MIVETNRTRPVELPPLTFNLMGLTVKEMSYITKLMGQASGISYETSDYPKSLPFYSKMEDALMNATGIYAGDLPTIRMSEYD